LDLEKYWVVEGIGLAVVVSRGLIAMGRNIFCFVFDRKLVFFELHDCDFSDSRLGTKLFQNAQTCSFLSTLMETGSHIIFEPCSS